MIGHLYQSVMCIVHNDWSSVLKCHVYSANDWVFAFYFLITVHSHLRNIGNSSVTVQRNQTVFRKFSSKAVSTT